MLAISIPRQGHTGLNSALSFALNGASLAPAISRPLLNDGHSAGSSTSELWISKVLNIGCITRCIHRNY